VGDVVSELPVASVAFNAPTKLDANEVAFVQVLVSRTSSVEALQYKLDEVGARHGARIRVHDVMEAQLKGGGFDIKELTSPIQGVDRETEWKWEIRGTREGHQRLRLTLWAVVGIDGVPAPYNVRTFERTIDVEVTMRQRIMGYAEGLTWLWPVILVPLVGLVWRVWKRRRDRAQKAEQYGWPE
jgi:hypothetical protein